MKMCSSPQSMSIAEPDLLTKSFELHMPTSQIVQLAKQYHICKSSDSGSTISSTYGSNTKLSNSD